MNELVFIGLGLHDEKGISLKGLEETQNANYAFMELYTNLLPQFSAKRFEAMVNKRVRILSRRDLEEENGSLILNAAEKGKTVFLVPGDPFVATTHVTLRIEAEKRGIKTRIVHGASAISAIIGLSGLHNYKFGKTVTLPFPENFSETPYNVIAQNMKQGLHTLCLMDLKVDENRFLSINEALTSLLEIEQRRKEGIVTPNTMAVGVARAGSSAPTLKADFIKKLLKYDFGDPPQSLIFPGDLHFMESEALAVLAGGPEESEDGRMSVETLVTKYIGCAEQVLKEMQRTNGPINVTQECVSDVLGYATSYLKDAKYYKTQKKFETSLTSVAYCEGLLDALRLLGAVKFEWPAKKERKK